MKAQILLKNLQWLGRHNPGFPPGSVQTAVAELLNPTSSILPYSGHLCLGEPRVVCTGTKYFNIDAGKTKNVNFPILMPTAEGTYSVHLDIFSNDQLLEAYRAAEDVIIGEVAPPTQGELVIAYVWWEGKDGWNEIRETTNTWPPYTGTTTTWKIRNTGNKSAFFKVRFMGKTSAGVSLSPGEEATLYLYPVTPSAGSYDYTLDIIADGTVVKQYPVRVIVEAPPPGISLKAGWNEEILYPGVTQSVEAAFASIEPYFMLVYYWTGEYWITPTTMVTGNYYSIKVSQDCEWTF